MVATRSARRAERAERAWSALPKCGLEQVVLHHLADDWCALGRVGVVCKAWEGAVDGLGDNLWRSALSGWRAAHPDVDLPDLGDDFDAVDGVRFIAGLRVVPRRVEPASVLLSGVSHRSGGSSQAVTVGGVVTGAVSLAEHIASVDASLVWRRENNALHVFRPEDIEGYAVVKLLQSLAAQSDDEVLFGGRYRYGCGSSGPPCAECGARVLGEAYLVRGSEGGFCPKCAAKFPPEKFAAAVKVVIEPDAPMPAETDGTGIGDDVQKKLAMIAHDLWSDPDNSTGGSPWRISNADQLAETWTPSFPPNSPEQPRFYGCSREVLRGVFLDKDFAPDGEDLAACLRLKMETWTFYAMEDGQAGAHMLNVGQRYSREECPPECPTTHFYAGMQFNFDQLGDGSILIALEHAAGAGPLVERPIKSIVVLAERKGATTYPWKPGDGGYYEDQDY
mmetsp:Transcript_13599/g.40512  ORF Transcript_13599/g.40512 Transcript_13599/m.40512 type:complete len:448 (-) Transcript_13599:28-1371(-)